MMKNADERVSLCVLKVRNNTLIRVIDCILDGNAVQYHWVYGNNNEISSVNPHLLYNKSLVKDLKKSNMDFVFASWAPNEGNSAVSKALRPHAGYDLYEVIKCNDVTNFEQLGDRLAAGLPYDGVPSRTILITLSGKQCCAVLLNREDFIVQNNVISLNINRPIIANTYILDKSTIKSIKGYGFRFHCRKYFYCSPILPNRTGRIVIQPYGHLNGEGIFLIESVDLLSTASEKTKSVDLVETPNGASDEIMKTIKELNQEIADKRKEIAELEEVARQRSATNDRLAKLTEEMTVKRNDAHLLLERKLKEIEDEATRRQTAADERIGASIRDAEARRDEAVRQLERTRKDAEAEVTRLRSELDDATAELARTKTTRQEMLDRLDEDVLLKVGLRAVANRQDREPWAAAISMPSLATYPVRKEIDERRDMVAAVDANLGCFGVAATDRTHGTNLLAKGLVASLSGTNLLAMDSTFAPAVANSLAYAAAGMPAKHASIPVDWNDAAGLERLLADDPTPVIVLDNVFDTVNESLLFALTRSMAGGAVDKVLVLPVGAYGNLRMVASEVWSHMFYVPTEGALPLPSAEPHRAYRSAEPFRPRCAHADAVVGQASRLRTMGQGAGTLASFVMPACIVETNYREYSIKAMIRWTLPHMALHALASCGSQSAAALMKNADAMYGNGISDLARALLRRVDATPRGTDGR